MEAHGEAAHIGIAERIAAMIALNFIDPTDGCDLPPKEILSLLKLGLESETTNEASPRPSDLGLILLAIPGDGITPAISEPMKTALPEFQFFIQRDFCDDEIEVAIKVKEFRPSGKNGNLDHRDPSYDPGYVEFGDAYSVPPGTPITLTKRELDQAETAFWGQ